MKICLINGSPKKENSASGQLLEALQTKLNAQELILCHAAELPQTPLAGSQALVFAFPLYVDGIPAHLLRELEAQEKHLAAVTDPARIYVLVNNGFYEGRQNALALDLMRNWCRSAGLQWGQGLGLGGGGAIGAAPLGYGPLKNPGQALDQLAQNILALRSAPDLLIQINMPRLLYQAAAHYGWYATARKNGLRRRDLKRRLESAD